MSLLHLACIEEGKVPMPGTFSTKVYGSTMYGTRPLLLLLQLKTFNLPLPVVVLSLLY